MKGRLTRVGAVAGVLLMWNATAWAHAALSRSEPAKDAVLAEAPKQVQLQFTEALEPTFSAIEVTDSVGKAVTARKASVAPASPSALRLDLPSLTAGAYKVHWSAVTRDGHRVRGDYGFVVK